MAEDARKNEEQQGSPEASNAPQVGTRYSAAEIHENILEAAEEEMDRPVSELAYSGVASGLGIGFSFLAVTFATHWLGAAHRTIAGALAYPLGFIYVVLARHQLFTENTLEPVLPVLERHNAEALRSLLRLWGIVLPANLVGAAIFALVLARTRVVPDALTPDLLEVARAAGEGGALLVFYKAIWAGWLIALMAWLLSSTRETLAQIALIWLTTAPIAAFEFKHSIAGAVESFYRVWLGDLSFGACLTSFELPALAGNIVGGVVLVALVNHGQAGGRKGASR
ncbi:MAG TPA: formate/nitrite transporter family protein [Gemmatimonadaceae bacterium]|nr:formate/nitrite transporter family protein [Gemmatimonadaceae bacterium]